MSAGLGIYALYDCYINLLHKYYRNKGPCVARKSVNPIIYSNNNVVVEEDSKYVVYFNENPSLDHVDLESLLCTLQQLDKSKDLKLYLATTGGYIHVRNLICAELKKWKGVTTISVSRYAHSSGTIIALVADHLYMSKTATLSAINPVLPWYDKKYLCSYTASLFLENPETNYVDQTKSLINKKYDVDKIIKVMCDDVPCHNTVFDIGTVQNIIGFNLLL